MALHLISNPTTHLIHDNTLCVYLHAVINNLSISALTASITYALAPLTFVVCLYHVDTTTQILSSRQNISCIKCALTFLTFPKNPDPICGPISKSSSVKARPLMVDARLIMQWASLGDLSWGVTGLGIAAPDISTGSALWYKTKIQSTNRFLAVKPNNTQCYIRRNFKLHIEAIT